MHSELLNLMRDAGLNAVDAELNAVDAELNAVEWLDTSVPNLIAISIHFPDTI